MNTWKKIIAIGLVSVLAFSFCGCGTDKGSDSSSNSESSEDIADDKNVNSSDESSESSENSGNSVDESSVVYVEYEVEYDEKELDDYCANVIKDYFTAIEYQDYDAYKATLFPFYYETYNSYLKDNYNYGMETSMEQLHQMLLDSAGTENIVISGISVKPAQITEEDSEDTDLAETYLLYSDGNTRKLEHLITHSISIARFNGKAEVDNAVIKQTSKLLMA